MELRDRYYRRTARFTAVVVAIVVCCVSRSQLAAQDETSSTDQVSAADRIDLIKPDRSGRRVLSGVIEDLIGTSVIVRRGAALDVVPLSNVRILRYSQPPELVDGMTLLRTGDAAAAIERLQAAFEQERRPWVQREILAAQARAMSYSGRFEDAIAIVERIVKSDEKTRHLMELPLVWDERLAANSRVAMTPDDLQHESPLRQLVAVSVLVNDPQHADAAATTLATLRRSPVVRINQICEVLSWRRALCRPEVLTEVDVQLWQTRAREFDARLRAVAELQVGRGLLALGETDRAVSHLLWMPFVEPFDAATTRLSAGDAVAALRSSGRTEEADRLAAEFSVTN